jgi:hypothetical protein
VDPRTARHALGTFRAFGARINCGVFPFGSTDGRGKLAVDERGRLFCVDHGGWWFLGESVDEGLGALAEGRAPRRVRDDGTWAQALEGPWSWTAPPVRDIDAVTDVVRALAGRFGLKARCPEDVWAGLAALDEARRAAAALRLSRGRDSSGSGTAPPEK